MGLGDEIMVTGEARRLQQTDPRPVRVFDARGRIRWHPLWEDNPRLTADAGADAQILVNGSGARPYIDHARSTPERWAYTDWQATPGELPAIRSPVPTVVPYVVIEPNIKERASPNKQWGWPRWQALVGLLARRHPQVLFVQAGPPGTPHLPGLAFVETADFHAAGRLLAGAAAAILPEGGLHHAAAALGVPAVVLFGGFIRPRNTGYAAHRNLAVDCPDALGRRFPHPSCTAAWDRISPDLVASHLTELLDEHRTRFAA